MNLKSKNKDCEYCKREFNLDNHLNYFSLRIKEEERMYLCPKCKYNENIVIKKNHALNRFKLRAYDLSGLKRDFHRWTTSGEELFLIRDILESAKESCKYLRDSDPRKKAYLREQELYDIKKHERSQLLKLREKVKDLVRELIIQCEFDPLYPTENNIKIFTEKIVKDTSIQQFPVAMKIVDDIKRHHDSTQHARDNKRKIDSILKKELREIFEDNHEKIKKVFFKIKSNSEYVNYQNKGGDPTMLVNRLVADIKHEEMIKKENIKIKSLLSEIFEGENESYMTDEEINKTREMLTIKNNLPSIQDLTTKIIDKINEDTRLKDINKKLNEKGIDPDDVRHEQGYIHYRKGELTDLDWIVERLEDSYWKKYRYRNIITLISKKFTGCRLEYAKSLPYYNEYIENGGKKSAEETFERMKKDIDGIINRDNLNDKWKQWTKNNKIPSCLKIDVDDFFCRMIEKKLFDLIDDEDKKIISIDNQSYRYNGYRFIEKRCDQLGLRTRRTLNRLEIKKS